MTYFNKTLPKEKSSFDSVIAEYLAAAATAEKRGRDKLFNNNSRSASPRSQPASPKSQPVVMPLPREDDSRKEAMALRAKLKALEAQMTDQEAKRANAVSSRQELIKCEQNSRDLQRRLEDSEAARLEAEVRDTRDYRVRVRGRTLLSLHLSITSGLLPIVKHNPDVRLV